MAIPSSYIRYCFGIRNGISNCIGYFDENTIVYPCGSNLVLYNMEARVQKFLAGIKKSEAMTAMAVSPNRRFAALAECVDRKAIISIYDLISLKKVNTLIAPLNLNIRIYLHICFSPDSKFLATQGGEFDYHLVLWNWEKGKILTSCKTASGQNVSISQVCFNPFDNTQISVVGDALMKSYRYVDSEKNLRQFGKSLSDPHNILCNCWVGESTLIVGTKLGLLFLVENGVKKVEFNLGELFVQDEVSKTDSTQDDTSQSYEEPSVKSSSHQSVTALVSFSKGFVAACGPGIINWFETYTEEELEDMERSAVNDQMFPYKRVYEIIIPQDNNRADPVQWSTTQTIIQMAMSPGQRSLICCTNTHQIYYLNLTTLEMTKKGGQCPLEPLSNLSFHHNTVLSVDVCLRKPLIATASADNSVRIWNFENFTLDIYKEFAEEIFSIALHPSGLYILVGFSDKLRLMNLLIDDIRTFKEFNIRGCRECAFSTGGQLIAAVNGNLITIYSTTLFKSTAILKGHNGKIKTLLWSADDRKLISCGLDGAVYEWDPFTGQRLNESVLKACGYNNVAITGDGSTTYAVGNDKTVKEISESQIQKELPSDVVLTTIALSNSGRMLLCGTVHGTVRSMKFPLGNQMEFQEHLGHCSQITKMRFTCNDEYMVTVSEDCSVMIWTIIEKDGRNLVKEKDIHWADEILVTKFDLEQKNAMMTELKTRVEELKVENEYQLRLKDMNYKEKIADITKQFVVEMESLRVCNEKLHVEKEADKLHQEEQLHEMTEKHSKELADVQEQARLMLKSELVKYHELMDLHQKTTVDYEDKIHKLGESREAALEELTDYYENKLSEKAQVVNHLTQEMRDQTMEFDTQRRLVEEDADREILDIKIKYECRLKDEKETNARLKGETGVMRKKFNTLNKEIFDQKEEIKKCQTEMQKLDLVIRTLEKEVQGLKKEVQERDETIQDKERRIYDLKRKNQELEKFKFVLDYRVKELRKQIEPREREIRACKEQIKNMEGELDNFAKQSSSLEVTISELKHKLKSSERQLVKERQATRSWINQMDRIKTDLYHCSGLIQEPKKLKDSIISISQKYITSPGGSNVTVENDVISEMDVHRNHLERTVKNLSKKIRKDTEIHKSDYMRMMKENVSLLNEINALRKELKTARLHIHDLEATMHLTRREGATARELLAAIKENQHNPVLEKDMDEARHIIEAQRAAINKMQTQITTLKEKSKELNNNDGMANASNSAVPFDEVDEDNNEEELEENNDNAEVLKPANVDPLSEFIQIKSHKPSEKPSGGMLPPIIQN